MLKVELNDGVLYRGNTLKVLPTLPKKSVHLVVTSPPYFNLRDYGTGRWEGGSGECDHKNAKLKSRYDYSLASSPIQDGKRTGTDNPHYRPICPDCGAKRIDEQIGQEELHDCQFWATGKEPCRKCFNCHLCEVFTRVHRVLRDDGLLVINLGDSYASGGMGSGSREYQRRTGTKTTQGRDMPARKPPTGLKHKDLCGTPWRLALALQALGWYWRSELPWVKTSPVPESADDRPGRSLEHLLVFSKKRDYYWDMEAVLVKAAATYTYELSGENKDQRNFRTADLWLQSMQHPYGLVSVASDLVGLDALSRSSGILHYATFPPELVKPFILAGTSSKCCAQCQAPWLRKVEKERVPTRPGKNSKIIRNGERLSEETTGNRDPKRHITRTRTLGWEPSCDCNCKKTVPATVLDPFGGVATTALTALLLGRRFISIELSKEYHQVAVQRIKQRGQLKQKREEVKPNENFSLFLME